jgi:single-strand DNA-binding protein
VNIQHLFISGRATKDAELLESKNGNKFTKFSIAVNEFIKKTKEEKVYFYDVLVFSTGAELASDMVKKGDTVIVQGKPKVDSYISNKDNEAKSTVSIIAESWKVLK